MFFDKPNSIIHFLKNGISSVFYINLNDSINTLKEVYGEPINIVGTKDNGHYHYSNGVRFSYKNDKINEIDIKMMYDESINFILDKKIPLLEIDSVNINTPIHAFIFILNEFNILWRSYNEKNKSVFALLTEGGVCVVFDLETGELVKIVINSYLIECSKQFPQNSMV